MSNDTKSDTVNQVPKSAIFKISQAHKVEKKPVSWLWYPFIQREKLNGLSGMPGTGKTTIACDVIAKSSTARPLPGETKAQAEKRGVLRSWFITNEDDEGDLRWKLENQGADLNQVLITDEVPDFRESGTRKDFEACIKSGGLDFVVIDSLSSIPFCDDMNSPAAGQAMARFKSIATHTGATILFLRHRSKKSEGEGNSSVSSGLGSITISGQWRSEIGAISTKKGSKIIRMKGNTGPTNLQLAYDIGGSGNDHGRLSWSGEPEAKTGADIPNEGKAADLRSWLDGRDCSDLTALRKAAQEVQGPDGKPRWSRSLVFKTIQ